MQQLESVDISINAITDIVNVAIFVVSELGAGMTGTTVNVACGTPMD